MKGDAWANTRMSDWVGKYEQIDEKEDERLVETKEWMSNYMWMYNEWHQK